MHTRMQQSDTKSCEMPQTYCPDRQMQRQSPSDSPIECPITQMPLKMRDLLMMLPMKSRVREMTSSRLGVPLLVQEHREGMEVPLKKTPLRRPPKTARQAARKVPAAELETSSSQ